MSYLSKSFSVPSTFNFDAPFLSSEKTIPHFFGLSFHLTSLHFPGFQVIKGFAFVGTSLFAPYVPDPSCSSISTFSCFSSGNR